MTERTVYIKLVFAKAEDAQGVLEKIQKATEGKMIGYKMRGQQSEL